MKHVYDEEESLVVCKVCGLFEGSLTTNCPGESVPYDIGEEVYAGKLDYKKEGGWVKDINPTNESWVYGDIFRFLTKKEGAAKHEYEIIIKFGITKERYNEIKSRLVKDMYA